MTALSNAELQERFDVKHHQQTDRGYAGCMSLQDKANRNR